MEIFPRPRTIADANARGTEDFVQVRQGCLLLVLFTNQADQKISDQAVNRCIAVNSDLARVPKQLLI
jgi:hypothetical protein